MKRDLDLIREILFKAEEVSGEGNKPVQLEFSTDSPDKIGYHVYLLTNAGLLDADINKTTFGTYSLERINDLTWEGHEFLDNIRNDTVWAKVKSKAKEKMSSVSMKVLASLAEDYVKDGLM